MEAGVVGSQIRDRFSQKYLFYQTYGFGSNFLTGLVAIATEMLIIKSHD